MVQPSMTLSEIEIHRARLMDQAAHARLTHQIRAARGGGLLHTSWGSITRAALLFLPVLQRSQRHFFSVRGKRQVSDRRRVADEVR